MSLYQTFLGTTEQAQIAPAQVGPVQFNDQMARVLPFYQQTKLTSAQLLAMDVTPVSLVAAPGAGLALVCLGVFGFNDFNSVAYASTDATLDIKYQNASGGLAAQLSNAFIEASADAYQYAGPQLNVVALANKALVASASATLTDGDGAFYLRVYYQVVRIADFS